MVRLPRFFTVLKSRIVFVKMCKFEKSVNFNDRRSSEFFIWMSRTEWHINCYIK